MAELLVRTQDNSDPDPMVNLKSYKRGMVITVQDDGWNWGTAETVDPFMVIQVPDMTVAAASVFLGSLINPASLVRDTTNPLRSFMIDLDSLPVATSQATSTSPTTSIPTSGITPTSTPQMITMVSSDLLALKTPVLITNPLIIG